MAGEFKHKDIPNDPNGELTQVEYESTTHHQFDSQSAGDILYASSSSQLSRLGRGTRGLGSATITVAASDASAGSLALADYVCDGTADNVQIQAAIDALPAPGGKVILSEGTFILTAKVIITSGSLTIEGLGQASTIVRLDTASQIGFSIEPAATIKQFTFRDFRITDNSSKTTIGIDFAGTPVTKEIWQIFIDQCDFRSTSKAIRGSGLDGVWITRNWFYASEDAAIDISTMTDVHIQNNHVDTATNLGFYVHPTRGVMSTGLYFSDNVLFAVKGHNIHIDDNDLNVITNNVLVDQPVGSTGNALRMTTGGDRFYIANNEFRVNNSTADAVYIADMRDGFIIGNTIKSDSATGGDALHLKTVGITIRDIQIIGNLFPGAGYHGIEVEHGDYVKIIGNTVADVSRTTANTYSAISAGDFDNGIIKDNIFYVMAGVKYGVYIASGISSYFGDNVFGTEPATARYSLTATTPVMSILGYSKNSGTATVLNTATSIAVAHGLATTPTRVQITPRENPTNAVTFWWVDTVGATNFTINVNADPGASNLDFDWHAQVGEG